MSPSLVYKRIEWLLGDDRLLIHKGDRVVIDGVEELLAKSQLPTKLSGAGPGKLANEMCKIDSPSAVAASTETAGKDEDGDVWEL